MLKRSLVVALVATMMACGGSPATDGGVGGGGGSVGGGGGSTGGGSGGGTGGGSMGGGTGGGSMGGGTGGGSVGGGTGGGGTTDTTPPEVVSTTPSAGSTGVPVGTTVQVAFSEPMNPGTVTVTGSPSISFGNPSWNATNSTLTLTPSAALSFSTSYTLTINGADVAGNALSSAVTVMFTTEAQPDTTPPTVVTTQPSNGTTGVGSTSSLTIIFSESMNTASVTVTPSPSVALNTPIWTNNNTELSLTPTTAWAFSTMYSFTVNGQDVSGNAMASAYSFSFTSAGPPDTTPPTLTSSTPANNAMNVTTTTRLSLTFSEAMDTTTVMVSTTPAIDQGTATWTNGDKTVTFSAPTADWANSTSYTVSVSGADLAGNMLAATSVAFTTAAPPDTTPPTVQSTTPAPGATGVPTGTALQFVFSEPMNTASQMAFSSNPAITCTYSWLAGDALLQCVPSAPLTAGTAYTVTLATTATDKAGNALAAPYVLNFTTAMAPDTTAPTILSTSPATTPGAAAPGTIGVPQSTTTVSVTFSEPMNKASAQAALQFTSPAGLNGGLFSWNTAGDVMTYTIPGAPLAYGTAVVFSVSNTATDLAGNALAAASTGTRRFRLRRQAFRNLYSCASCTPATEGAACTTVPTCTETVSSGYVTATPADCSNSVAATTTTGYARWGDSSNNTTYYRGYMNFDMTYLDSASFPNVYINSATLNVRQLACGGTPYGSCTTLISCLLSGAFVYAYSVDYGTSLGGGDCSVATGTGGYFASRTTTPGSKTADVTSAMREQWTAHTARGNRAQFMIRRPNATNNGNSVTDYCDFATQGNTTATNRPFIAVTFEYD